jgi:hypothetical protein
MNPLGLASEELLKAVRGLLYGWLTPGFALFRELLERCRHRRRLRKEGYRGVRCQVIPGTVYKRPDPLIYSQTYLMSLGLAVTWDNPDITLFRNGAPAPSSALLPNTEYEIRATIWNGSNDAPAIGMPVEFSFLSFGIGTTSTGIGTTKVDLPVRGAPGHPTLASMKWRTPATPGHYCIQVNLIWADDANPKNNLGQKNTTVGAFHSPAVFEFPVFNAANWTEHVTLTADTYTLPEPINCDDVVNGRLFFRDGGQRQRLTPAEICKLLADQQRAGLFPIPSDWTVDIVPKEFDTAPGASVNVTVTVTPPASFTSGTRAFNINAFNRDHKLLGGVTLYTQR